MSVQVLPLGEQQIFVRVTLDSMQDHKFVFVDHFLQGITLLVWCLEFLYMFSEPCDLGRFPILDLFVGKGW